VSIRVTERSLYGPLSNILRKYGVENVQEVAIEGGEYPDLLAKLDEYRFVIEVKIDRESRLLEVTPRAFAKAIKVGAQGAISILFPHNVREVHPDLLGSLAPTLKVSAAVVALPWLSDYWKELTLEEFAERIAHSYKLYLEARRPTVSYDIIVKASIEAVVEISSSIRRNLLSKYKDDAVAIVGRFDIYRAMLEDLNVKLVEMEAWIADIAAYLVTNQILFYHVLSKKTGKYPPLPEVNPLHPDKGLLKKLGAYFAEAAKEYEPIFGPDLLSVIKKSGGKSSLVAVARYIVALNALKPEHVKEELLGRLYQESIPPEARKNLGAFFTRPKAATILATLAIDRWDEKVLDPACGAGTLLTEAYQRRKDLAPQLPEKVLHKTILERTYGIDVMHFAYHMTCVNLLAQNLTLPVKLTHIRAGDGIEPQLLYVEGKEEDPPVIPLTAWTEKVKPEHFPSEAFDCVIMNPPFTRRERLAAISEARRLDKLLGDKVRGKVGYWAYFLAAADNVVKYGGKLASVTPEEFFAGGSAESLRRFLFLGEKYDAEKKAYVKRLQRWYTPLYVVRSGVEVAFSEGALYRDYLMVLSKGTENTSRPLTFIILKKRLDEIEDARDVARSIRSFAESSAEKLQTEVFDGIKVKKVKQFLDKHISNLKPIVGLNVIETQELLFELLDRVAGLPTLAELEKNGTIAMHYYNPGQYLSVSKGVEREARLLFATRYGAGGKWVFRIIKEEERSVLFEEKIQGKRFKMPLEALVRTLRTYSGVKHIDITDEEEYAIVEPNYIPNDIRRFTGLINPTKVRQATEDIRKAYDELAGDLLLVRKLQIPSPNIYWLAFRSSNRVLGTTDRINVRIPGGLEPEPLCLYLNSSIAFLQLLAFHIETRGAWIRLDKEGVWSEIHVPDFWALKEEIRHSAKDIYKRLGRADVAPFYDRLKNRSSEQHEIDLISLKMLGLESWENKLNELHSAIIAELEFMLKTLNTSKRFGRKNTKESEQYEEVQETLEWSTEV
jgi:Holliday junction resolvase